MAVSNELADHLQYPKPVYLSYFEGPPYDLYATNISNHFFLTLVHDRNQGASRIGLVWLYTRRSLEKIVHLLRQEGEETLAIPLEEGFTDSVQAELEDLFADAPAPKSKASAPPNRFPTPRNGRHAGPIAKRFGDRVDAILEQFSQQTGIANERSLSVLNRLPMHPPQVDELVIRVISECLKNVYLHGQATIVGVSFQYSNQMLQARIADNGVGFNMRHAPNLKTMAKLQREVQQAQGQLNISAYPQQGTNVNLQLPLA